jgi:pyrroline-5-carboxylate reductase
MRICFIGGGNMATALIGGLRESDPQAVIEVVDPSEEARARLTRDHGLQAHARPDEAAPRADVLVLAVKPQLLDAALGPVASLLAENPRPDRLLLSVLAGTPLGHLRALLAEAGTDLPLVRAMPNTPALLGAGITALCAGPDCGEDHRRRAESLLRGAGEVVWIEDEELMHVVTGLSGSGPAYFFLLIEALRDAGVALGLDASIAQRLAVHTAHGAGLMARDTGVVVDELRRRVTSPGGTTEAGLASLEAGDLRGLVLDAVRSATRRGREMAGESTEEPSS